MTGLGGYMPSDAESYAWDVSGDGTTIVGRINLDYVARPSTNEAFRWTQAEGLQMLGDLPGGDLNSIALATSSDGSVVVGHGEASTGQQAFIWDASDGIRSIAEVLLSMNVDISGWNLLAATGISADGLTMVGAGINPAGNQEGWILTFDSGSDDAPIPEPRAFLIIALCLAGIMLTRNGLSFRS